MPYYVCIIVHTPQKPSTLTLCDVPSTQGLPCVAPGIIFSDIRINKAMDGHITHASWCGGGGGSCICPLLNLTYYPVNLSIDDAKEESGSIPRPWLNIVSEIFTNRAITGLNAVIYGTVFNCILQARSRPAATNVPTRREKDSRWVWAFHQDSGLPHALSNQNDVVEFHSRTFDRNNVVDWFLGAHGPLCCFSFVANS